MTKLLFTVYLHVFTQGRRMCIRLVTAQVLAVVRFIAGVDVRVLLPVGAVREATITSRILTSERLLAYFKKKIAMKYLIHATVNVYKCIPPSVGKPYKHVTTQTEMTYVILESND